MSLRMLLAAEKGDTAEVLSYLEQGADINAQDEFGLTALVWAAKRGDVALTTALLPYRPDLEATDRHGRTPLLIAAQGGYAELVALLLNAGASLGVTDSNGHTLLHMASASGQLELVKQILAFESRLDAADSTSDTPLTLAITNSHYAVARFLIEQGADINWRGNSGRTPLLTLTMDLAGQETKDPEGETLWEELLRRDADLNLADGYGWTPLMRAAHKGDASFVYALLSHGAKAGLKDGQGLTAFQWAVRGGQTEMMQLLKEYGADVNQPDASGQTMLLKAMRDPDPARIKTLLEMGSDPNVADKQGRTPLYEAATRDHRETVPLLLEYGAEINVTGPNGVSLLAKLVEQRQYAMTLLLLNSGATPPGSLSELLGIADLNAPDEYGWSPLGRAVSNNEPDLARLLLRAGADVNASDRNGTTPLMDAVCRPSEEIVALLLEAGADVNAKDASGVTALMKAIECVCANYVVMLMTNGADVNAIDNSYGTPLSRAKLMGHTETIERLLAAGAKLAEPPPTDYPSVTLPGWDRDPLPGMYDPNEIAPYDREDREQDSPAGEPSFTLPFRGGQGGVRGEVNLPSWFLPLDREVECDCPEPLPRSVLRDPGGLSFRVTACMRCGNISYIEVITEEPRPHDVQHVANRQYALGADAKNWLMQWPRRVKPQRQGESPAFLPASFRCQNETELLRIEAEVRKLEAGLSLQDCLLKVGVPETPPPHDLPEPLRYFAEVWDGLRLTTETPFDRLVKLAALGHGASSFAQELLIRRPGFEAELLTLLREENGDTLITALTMVQNYHLDDVEIVAVLVERIENIDWQGREIHTLLDTLLALEHSAAPATDALKRLAAKIGNADYYLTQRIEEIRKKIRL